MSRAPSKKTTQAELDLLLSQGSLAPGARRVASFIRQNMTEVLAGTAADIGARTGTSDATVVRTLQKLGFGGLSDLKATILEVLRSPADDLRRSLADMETTNRAAFDSVIHAHLEAIEVLRSEPVRQAIGAAAALIDQANRIALFGIGPSSAIASYAGKMLKRAGYQVVKLTATGGGLADELLALAPGDVLLAMAYGTPYSEIVGVLGEARALGLPRILLTERADGPLIKFADLVIAVPRGRPGQVALHGGTMVALEALIMSVIARNPDRSLNSLRRLNDLRRAVK